MVPQAWEESAHGGQSAHGGESARGGESACGGGASSRVDASTLHQPLMKRSSEWKLASQTEASSRSSLAIRGEESIVYYVGWKVESLSLDDQIFMSCINLCHNYTNLQFAQLFQCSSTCVTNVALTFIYVLCKLWFNDIMTTVPSQEKNM